MGVSSLACMCGRYFASAFRAGTMHSATPCLDPYASATLCLRTASPAKGSLRSRRDWTLLHQGSFPAPRYARAEPMEFTRIAGVSSPATARLRRQCAAPPCLLGVLQRCVGPTSACATHGVHEELASVSRLECRLSGTQGMTDASSQGNPAHAPDILSLSSYLGRLHPLAKTQIV